MYFVYLCNEHILNVFCVEDLNKPLKIQANEPKPVSHCSPTYFQDKETVINIKRTKIVPLIIVMKRCMGNEGK